MREKKFRKQVTEVIQDKFQEFDVTLAKLLITFRQLYNDIANNESRIKKIETAVQDLRIGQALTKSDLAAAILKNHKLKRQLRRANRNTNFIHFRTMEFRDEMAELKSELITLRNAKGDSTENTKDNEVVNDEFPANKFAMSSAI